MLSRLDPVSLLLRQQPVLLNLPLQILEQVAMAVGEQGVTRSQFLRQAIERNLRHYQRVALGNANKPSSEAKHLYRHQEGLNPQLVRSAVWHIAVLVFVGPTRAVRLRLCLQPKLKGTCIRLGVCRWA